jgi:hypothetical protein
MNDDQKKIVLTWMDGRGKKEREIDPVFDIRDFRGTPAFALLAVAVGSHSGMSIMEIVRWLNAEGIGRSWGWVQRRRWLSRPPGTVNRSGARANIDGLDDRAVTIMREYPTLSVRRLAWVLRENGIRRSSEWVRQNRCR